VLGGDLSRRVDAAALRSMRLPRGREAVGHRALRNVWIAVQPKTNKAFKDNHMPASAPPIEIRSRWDNAVLFASRKATLAEALTEAVAAGANLSRADLTRANLASADLAGADLSRANLAGAHLAGTDLSRAILAGAILAGANLARADLAGANFAGAHLAGAHLAGTNLAGTNLAGANLAGAHLAGAENGGKDTVVAVATVHFTGHGECGRALTAIKGTKSTRLLCGCCQGTVEDFRTYIANGESRLHKTRTLALDTVLMLLEARNDESNPTTNLEE
jgi:hypothetical protein